MKILFEEYSYKTSELKNVLSERYYFPINSEFSKVNYIGYYFNSGIGNGSGDSVIILPKVFLNERGKAFDKYEPEKLIHIEKGSEIFVELKADKTYSLIFEISTWLYRAIHQFKRRQKTTQITDTNFINQVISNLDETSITELDIVLSLLKFHKENRHLFTFILKTNHSQHHKVSWGKTISKKAAFIQNGSPYYPEVISKKKQVNIDEELLIIFYSTIDYLKDKYSFNISTVEHFQLLKGRDFEHLLNSGTRKLKSIKYKYYSDKLLLLWNLLYAFFSRSEAIRKKKQFEEILVVRDFNIVFEDMIDDLIADTNSHLELKYHKDGKQVDHVYSYRSLVLEDDIYFVGDSKYYKPENAVGTYSIAKQYTYAKNIIQYNIDLFNEGRQERNIKYRDSDLTEGYNITPNFFISAFIEETFDFKNSFLTNTPNTSTSFQFRNRLFDRDTLILQSYSINFLFVLANYISNSFDAKRSFKEDTRRKFRQKLISFFNEQYLFYLLSPKSGTLHDLVVKYFKLINGKIYRPSQFHDRLIFAVLKSDTSILTTNEYESFLKECKIIEFELT